MEAARELTKVWCDVGAVVGGIQGLGLRGGDGGQLLPQRLGMEKYTPSLNAAGTPCR